MARGLDAERILRCRRGHGIVGKEHETTRDARARRNLIFKSGLSTASRQDGPWQRHADRVPTQIERLGGKIRGRNEERPFTCAWGQPAGARCATAVVGKTHTLDTHWT